MSESVNQALEDDVQLKRLWSKTHEAEAVKNFIEAITRLCWKMVLQRPPMEFKTSDKYEGETLQELYWNSPNPDTVNSPVITVYPMLYHGDNLIAKGKVLVQNPTKIQVYKNSE